MKIVIEIDDNLYTRLFDNGDEYVADMRRACVAIRKGTPLPKGHGRLIDATKVIDTINREYPSVDRWDIKQWIEDADTIIKADKAESEEQTE